MVAVITLALRTATFTRGALECANFAGVHYNIQLAY